MLKSYLASLPDDAARRDFAESCGTSLGHLRNCIYSGGTKLLAEKTCVLIEQRSRGAVRRWHLRTDWREIWPELESHPDAPQPAIVGPLHQLVTSGNAKTCNAIGTPVPNLRGCAMRRDSPAVCGDLIQLYSEMRVLLEDPRRHAGWHLAKCAKQRPKQSPGFHVRRRLAAIHTRNAARVARLRDLNSRIVAAERAGARCA